MQECLVWPTIPHAPATLSHRLCHSDRHVIRPVAAHAPARGDAGHDLLRLLLVRSQARPADRIRRHRRRRHVDHQPADESSAGRCAGRQDPDLSPGHRVRGHRRPAWSGRPHPDRTNLRRGCRTRRCARGEGPLHRPSHRLRLQRVQRLHPDQLRSLDADEDLPPRSQDA